MNPLDCYGIHDKEINMIETEKTSSQDANSRKNYAKPEIVHEMELETRAGSPLGLPSPFDLPGSGL